MGDAALERLRCGETDTESELSRGATAFELSRGIETLDLDALAAHPSTMDTTPPNGSSIALLVEHRGASLLLAANAFPDVLAGALRKLATHRRVQSLQVDVFKLRTTAAAAILQASCSTSCRPGTMRSVPTQVCEVEPSRDYC